MSVNGGQRELFDDCVRIRTDAGIAERVWKRLKTYLGVKHRQRLFHAHLSGHPKAETLIYRCIAGAITERRTLKNAENLSISIRVDQLSQQVRREAHRMKGFIRFQQTKDGRYVALIAPRYDVLPLLRHHFESRYADQYWLIYDSARGYGIVYNCQVTREIRLGGVELSAVEQKADKHEHLCQTLWQRYYAVSNIRSRGNPALHRRQLPRRYWRYLTEKKPKDLKCAGSQQVSAL